ncbi:MAG: hypothetical protein P8046_14390 [Anaerolineales bacterium]
MVHGLENKYAGVMNFVYLDIDDPDTKDLQKELGYQVNWRPYIFFLNSDGEIVGDTLIGAQDGEVLELAVRAVLQTEGVLEN